MTKNEIVEYVKNYLVEHAGIDAATLTADTQLVSTRKLDSISTLTMLNHLEAHFNFEAVAEEVTPENLDSPSIIADYILSKKK